MGKCVKEIKTRKINIIDRYNISSYISGQSNHRVSTKVNEGKSSPQQINCSPNNHSADRT